MQKTDDDLMTVDDLAARFKLNVDHVRDRVVKIAGFPRPVVIGAARRWRRVDVLAWEKKGGSVK